MGSMEAATFILFSFAIVGGVFLLVFHIQDKRQARQAQSKTAE